MRALLLATVLLLLVPAAARAQEGLSAAADALSRGYVYVDPSAEAAGEIDAAALDREIRDSGEQIYVAVLPESAAAGSVDDTLRALRDDVGLSGTYALVLGREFRAGNTDREVAGMASGALRAHPGDIQATLVDFVDRVDGTSSGPGWLILLVFLPFVFVLGVGGLLITLVVRSNRRRRERDLAEVKRNTRDDLVSLGEDIRALELDMQMPGASEQARKAYADAVAAYERANRAFETARNVRDLKPAAEALEEGRYAMIWAREVLAGRTPPERRLPCFFDPRHGPSSRDVTWAPAGGTPRAVPACEADAQRVERGEEPDARRIDGKPYWEAGRAYAPFYSSFFPGLLIGSMVAGGWDNPTPSDYSGGSSWGGGDFGGGGGDFGGGGGGGDFGGGSF